MGDVTTPTPAPWHSALWASHPVLGTPSALPARFQQCPLHSFPFRFATCWPCHSPPRSLPCHHQWALEQCCSACSPCSLPAIQAQAAPCTHAFCWRAAASAFPTGCGRAAPRAVGGAQKVSNPLQQWQHRAAFLRPPAGMGRLRSGCACIAADAGLVRGWVQLCPCHPPCWQPGTMGRGIQWLWGTTTAQTKARLVLHPRAWGGTRGAAPELLLSHTVSCLWFSPGEGGAAAARRTTESVGVQHQYSSQAWRKGGFPDSKKT